jgi:HK97 family phage major capsid protein
MPARRARAKAQTRADYVGQRFEREAVIQILPREEGSESFKFSFSSEQPVERWFGAEVLSHDEDAADFSRLNNGAGPYLWNHNREVVLGRVDRAWIDSDRRGYCEVTWSPSTKIRGSEEAKRRLEIESGIVRNVSFAYDIQDAVERDGTIVVTKWQAMEVSSVSIPADPTVGLDRADDPSIQEESVNDAGSPYPVPTEMTTENPTVDLEVVRSEAIAAERDRAATIRAMTAKFNLADLGEELIRGGKSLSEAQAVVLERVQAREPQPIASAPEIGLTEKEVKSFSFVKALNYLANPGDRAAAEAAKFEIEVGRAAAAKYERSSNGIVVPNEILARDLTVGTASAGGNTVSTDLLTGSFVELLRNRLALANAGVTMLSGLQGNIAIPRQTSASTAYWVGESVAPTESQQAIDQINMTPKTVGAFVDYSRRLLLQSSIDVEAMVRSDLARVIALELDRAGIYGTGTSNQPLGLVNTTGVHSASLTSYGTFAELIAMETSVASANADAGSLRYIMNAAARGALKSTAKDASAVAAGFVWEDGEVNGYPAIVSNQLLSNDALFGDFSMMIMGMWSGLDLTVDPYAGATSGTVRIIALQDVDFAIKQPVAFTYGT